MRLLRVAIFIMLCDTLGTVLWTSFGLASCLRHNGQRAMTSHCALSTRL